MKIQFTKMHGAGNDFIVIDAIHQKINFLPHTWKLIAHRHFGIGADQILVVEASQSMKADFYYRIYNADGSESAQCGNGARAFAKFVYDQGLTNKKNICMQTMSRFIEVKLDSENYVTVDMGLPVFDTHQTYFDTSGLVNKLVVKDVLWPFIINDKVVWFSVLSMGNPHAVSVVVDINSVNVIENGKFISTHPRFLQGVNVEFMQINSRHNISLRTFERGAGETLACGSGACAAVVSGIQSGLLDSPVTVKTRGGELYVLWSDVFCHVIMRGPVFSVFTGEIDISLIELMISKVQLENYICL